MEPISPLLLPNMVGIRCHTRVNLYGRQTMALSEFPRLGFDPFLELRRMQSEMNRVFSGSTPAFRDFPPINIWLGDNSVVVTSELPGVTQNDVNLSLQEDVLTLEGARRPSEEQGATWQRRERTYGSFSRAVQLPFRVDPNKVQARFNNGMLEVELERLEADRPKKIEIRAA
jgi:HSP20 family protein